MPRNLIRATQSLRHHLFMSRNSRRLFSTLSSHKLQEISHSDSSTDELKAAAFQAFRQGMPLVVHKLKPELASSIQEANKQYGKSLPHVEEHQKQEFSPETLGNFPGQGFYGLNEHFAGAINSRRYLTRHKADKALTEKYPQGCKAPTDTFAREMYHMAQIILEGIEEHLELSPFFLQQLLGEYVVCASQYPPITQERLVKLLRDKQLSIAGKESLTQFWGHYDLSKLSFVAYEENPKDFYMCPDGPDNHSICVDLSPYITNGPVLLIFSGLQLSAATNNHTRPLWHYVETTASIQRENFLQGKSRSTCAAFFNAACAIPQPIKKDGSPLPSCLEISPRVGESHQYAYPIALEDFNAHVTRMKEITQPSIYQGTKVPSEFLSQFPSIKALSTNPASHHNCSHFKPPKSDQDVASSDSASNNYQSAVR